MYRGPKQDPVSSDAGRMAVRWLRRTAIAVSAAAMTLVLAGSPNVFAQASAPAEVTQQTYAIVRPSIVYIHTSWTGRIRDAYFEGEYIGHYLPGGGKGTPVIETGSSTRSRPRRVSR